jgi:lipoprotein-releasing system permease protein
MDWATYLACKNLFPSQRKFTFFTVMSIVGVALGVAVLVVVQSVMNGFQADVKENIVRMQGEIRVEGRNGMENLADFEKKLQNFSEIAAVAPYVCGVVMAMHGGTPMFPLAKGIDAGREGSVTDAEAMLSRCSLENLADDWVIVGEQLAVRQGIQVGDCLEIYTPLALEALRRDDIIFPRDVRVAGYFSAGSCDQHLILCSLPLMQDLYALGDGVHGVALKLREGQSVEKCAKKMQKNLGEEYRVTDWISGNGELLFALRWEKTMMFFVLLFILLVASFSISSSLIANVVRKVREIGLVIAIGGSRYAVAKWFCLQGFFIGLCGTALGMVSGVGVLCQRDCVIRWATRLLRWEGAQNYLSQFVRLPVAYDAWDFIFILLFSLLICVLSGIIPGLRASKINPAEALRCEQ